MFCYGNDSKLICFIYVHFFYFLRLQKKNLIKTYVLLVPFFDIEEDVGFLFIDNGRM